MTETFLICSECEGDQWVVVVEDMNPESFALTALRCATCNEEIETTRRMD